MTIANCKSDVDLLAAICGPADVWALQDEQLPLLAGQIRRHLIDTVSATGGHLGASLGTVELTIALHRVFRSPHDVIVFDTGHQTYAHKVLTGRAQLMPTLRQAGGLSGYPCRGESCHDMVENSHASVSLAWVDGIAKGLALQGRQDRNVVAVIGDGALTGGVAWEGFNNLGGTDHAVVVVINDNGRSYDPTPGAVAEHLRQLRHHAADAPNLFEALGFGYIGPVDGHDIEATCAALHRATAMSGPVVVHAVTAKGRGYAPAEADDSDRMHACGVIDPATGQPAEAATQSWTDVFEHELVRITDERQDIVAMTAAMRLPAGLGSFSDRYPNRVFDSGIAEQHLLASAAGLATTGVHPIVAVYSTFLHRGFDQLLLDIGLHALPVTLVLDRAGVTGPDGASHHGLWDLALLTNVPGMRIACPRDATRLRQQLHTAASTSDGPTALRYPKGSPGQDIPTSRNIDGVDVLYRSSKRSADVLLVAIGAMASACVQAARDLTDHHFGVTVVDPQWVWPLNPRLAEMAGQHRLTVCVEDGIRQSGIGAHLIGELSETSTPPRAHAMGMPLAYLRHASRSQILAAHQLTGPAISATCQRLLSRDAATTTAVRLR